MIATDPAANPGLGEMNRLRSFAGPPQEFWPAFLAAAAQLLGAARGILILRDPKQPERLKKLSDWAESGPADKSTLSFNRMLPDLTEQCIRHGLWTQPVEATPESKKMAIGINLRLPAAQEQCVAAFLLINTTEAQVREALVRLQLISDLPMAYQTNQTVTQAKTDVEKFASVLDVMVLVNSEERFRSAALAFCNGLATRFQCERVSLGWLEQGYVRLKTISHTERFDKNMAAVKALEMVMEEALDQNQEILWPAGTGNSLVTRDHERFAREQTVENICSLPFRTADGAVAVLTCERRDRAFSQVEIQQLRLACDQATRRLADLQGRDRWFGARWAALAKAKASRFFGPEHTWTKIGAIAGCIALIVLLLPIFSYRVEGNFILRGDEVTFLTAPFDGYIRNVQVRPGDLVTNGAPLLGLKTDDLELEEAEFLADHNRYLREAEKARASNSLAEMRVAQALADQSRARLELVQHRLKQATIAAPLAGVVVEGDLRQRVGAPVKKGEALFKIARLETLYVEAEINERNVHELANKTTAEIAFVAQPKLKFPIKITRLEPAAFPKEGQNVFLLRGEWDGKPEAWWRPGMSGICKINIEQRTLLWILTHRTVDFLRMFFWW